MSSWSILQHVNSSVIGRLCKVFTIHVASVKDKLKFELCRVVLHSERKGGFVWISGSCQTTGFCIVIFETPDWYRTPVLSDYVTMISNNVRYKPTFQPGKRILSIHLGYPFSKQNTLSSLGSH